MDAPIVLKPEEVPNDALFNLLDTSNQTSTTRIKPVLLPMLRQDYINYLRSVNRKPCQLYQLYHYIQKDFPFASGAM